MYVNGIVTAIYVAHFGLRMERASFNSCKGLETKKNVSDRFMVAQISRIEIMECAPRYIPILTPMHPYQGEI